MQHFILVMGVSGSGKTTVGKKLSENLGIPFIEADDAHPPANIAKMQAGQPLNDDDRQPWLANLAEEMNACEASGFVVTCSALKKKYRDFLRAKFRHSLQIVFLEGSFDFIKNRMQARDMAPILENIVLSEMQLALIVLSIAAGASSFSHVNDSGFWLVNRYLGLTEMQTLRSWTVMTGILGFVALSVILVLNVFV